MTLDAWRRGEVAVVGLGRSGRAATTWLLGQGLAVYASDAAEALAGSAVDEAATALRVAGATVDTGRHDTARIGRAVAVVLSPGVPPDAPPVVAARAAGVPIVAELELGWRALRDGGAQCIAVTGTNGKSTTTALTARVLTAAGHAAVAAGNIGRPLLDLVLAGEHVDWVVIEASSFQLHDAPTFAPHIGVVTNLAPNHLDRYPDLAAYYADKARLFANASDESVWVLNGDDPAVPSLAGDATGRRRTFRLLGEADAYYDREEGVLRLDGATLLARSDLPLIGDHNVANALAASLAAAAAGVARDQIAAGLRHAQGLEHRLELVRDVDGVRWINDSKSTNITSTRVAVAAMDRPFVLLLGGRHKGESYRALADVLAPLCRGVVAYGEAAPRIVDDLHDRVPAVRVATLPEAVDAAGAQADPGEAVLLSPACSSYDQFVDFVARGSAFRQLVADR